MSAGTPMHSANEPAIPHEPAHTPAPRHPAIELLARYRDILRVAWAHRHELAGPRRLADEQAFLPAALSLQETPVHPAPRRLAWALIALFLIALAWSIFGKIDIVAVASGRIIVSDRTKLVQPLENSVIRRILVREGDHVEAGQALVQLDPTAAQADKTSFDETRRSAQSEWLRTRVLGDLVSRAARGDGGLRGAEAALPKALVPKALVPKALVPKALVPKEWSAEDADNARAQLAAEWSDVTARLSKFAAERARREAEIATVRAMIDKLEATLPIVRQRERDFQALADQGFMSGHANQDRMRERIELERDLGTQQARLREAQAALQETQQTRDAYLAETRRTLSERSPRPNSSACRARRNGTRPHCASASPPWWRP
ncbi:hypothetical protein [Paracidovorax cattleyae]|uniref:hypothetical protein n=1 Tax=Paracidovorax cattleyae TaxID=80868 RepID=UPI003369FC1A